jgi:hypothetical protein
MSTAYRIADEPAPSALARFAVNPLYPFLTMMLGGTWIAWPWFALNSFAVGSPSRRRELLWLSAGAVAALVLSFGIFALVGSGTLPPKAARYAILTVVVAKLATSYAVFTLQSRTIEIYEYYGGKLQSGVLPLLLTFILGSRVIEQLPVVWRMVLQ